MAMPLPRSGASHFRLVRVEQSIPSLNGKTRIEGELLGIPDADGSMTVAHSIDVLTAEWIRENFGAGTYQIRWMGRRGERSHLQSLGNSLATILEDGAPEPQFRAPAPPPPPPPPPAAAPATPAHSPPFGSDPFTLFAYFEDKRELAIERERDRADRALEAERDRADRAAARDQALWQTLGMRSQAPATDPMLLAMLQEMRADSREVRERLRRLEEGYDDGDGDDGDAPPPYPPAAPLAPVANAPPAPQQRPPRDMNEALSRAGVELVGNLPGIIGAVGEMMRQQPAAALPPPPPAPPPPPMLRPMVRLPPPPPAPPPAPSPPSATLVAESDVNGWIDEAEAAEAAADAPDAAQ